MKKLKMLLLMGIGAVGVLMMVYALKHGDDKEP
jgi:hypothetical protein